MALDRPMSPIILLNTLSKVGEFSNIVTLHGTWDLGISRYSSYREETNMTQQISASPLLALGAGILILVRPNLLNYVIAAYLITDGALRLLGRRT